MKINYEKIILVLLIGCVVLMCDSLVNGVYIDTRYGLYSNELVVVSILSLFTMVIYLSLKYDELLKFVTSSKKTSETS